MLLRLVAISSRQRDQPHTGEKIFPAFAGIQPTPTRSLCIISRPHLPFLFHDGFLIWVVSAAVLLGTLRFGLQHSLALAGKESVQ